MYIWSTGVLAAFFSVIAFDAYADEYVEGHNGIIDISGSIYETPCSIEMTSLHQSVDLGVVSAAKLQRLGQQADPTLFHIRFQDCRRQAGSIRSEKNGNLTWDAYQPAVSIEFLAPVDPDDTRLAKVQGVTGMGLLLSDPLGRTVQFGLRGEPLFLTSGNSTETWKVQPTRTSAPLSSGAFRAVVGFKLNYE